MDTYIFGNWKQNGNLALVQQMASSLSQLPVMPQHKIAIFPPDVYLYLMRQHLLNSNFLTLGAQNLSAYYDGAYTGETSAFMLQQVGAEFVLVGHSERRQLFAETDEQVALKFDQAARANLIPVLCVGETEQQFLAGETQTIIDRQLNAVLTRQSTHKFIVAYEPIWAIGTGRSATCQQAQAVHLSIRQRLIQLQGEEGAFNTPIIYGGSVNASNMAELIAMPDINGVLVGGASLSIESFLAIIQNNSTT